jgi:lysophospholipase L1-like esterase
MCFHRLVVLAATIFAVSAHTVHAVTPVRVYLIGDSTVASYKEPQVLRGWGQFLQPYFDANVTVVNLALGGASSKSFLTHKRWQRVLNDKPEFVLIQFGHNDAHAADQPESTAADGEFRENLKRYVDSVRACGSTPILVTPVHMRVFDKSGHVLDTLGPYADAMKTVAAENQVGLIDLHERSREFFETLGKERSEQLASAPGDTVHFNEAGAKAIAELVARDLRHVDPRLAGYLFPDRAALPEGSR